MTGKKVTVLPSRKKSKKEKKVTARMNQARKSNCALLESTKKMGYYTSVAGLVMGSTLIVIGQLFNSQPLVLNFEH